MSGPRGLHAQKSTKPNNNIPLLVTCAASESRCSGHRYRPRVIGARASPSDSRRSLSISGSSTTPASSHSEPLRATRKGPDSTSRPHLLPIPSHEKKFSCPPESSNGRRADTYRAQIFPSTSRTNHPGTTARLHVSQPVSPDPFPHAAFVWRRTTRIAVAGSGRDSASTKKNIMKPGVSASG